MQTSNTSAFGVIPPSKPPRKCIARMTSSLNDIIMAQQTSENRLQINESQMNTFDQTNQVPMSMATSLISESNLNNSPVWRKSNSSASRSGYR